LPADEQLQFEEHKEQLIHEAKAKFLTNFKVDRNNKVVRQWAMDLALLWPTTTTLKEMKVDTEPFWEHLEGGWIGDPIKTWNLKPQNLVRS
jgi:hypothetical protein